MVESSGRPRFARTAYSSVLAQAPSHPATEWFQEDAMTTDTRLRSDESSQLADAARNVAEQATQTVESRASTTMDQVATAVGEVAQAIRRAGDELRQDQPQ